MTNCHFQVPGLALLAGQKQPDTIMYAMQNEFGAEGLYLEPSVPMKRWKVTFNDQMRYDTWKDVSTPVSNQCIKLYRDTETDELVPVEIDAVWTSELKHFDFGTDISSTAIARAVAREQWIGKYFDNLKDE